MSWAVAMVPSTSHGWAPGLLMEAESDICLVTFSFFGSTKHSNA